MQKLFLKKIAFQLQKVNDNFRLFVSSSFCNILYQQSPCHSILPKIRILGVEFGLYAQ